MDNHTMEKEKMSFKEDDIKRFLRKEGNTESHINIMYGLANNCPSCHWFPCICDELRKSGCQSGCHKDCVDKQRLQDIMKRLGHNNLMSGDASEEHKLLRTGYKGALENIRTELKL